MSFFSVTGLTAGYGGRPVVENITFSGKNGELVGILGGNGCGKTTFLKAVCGILPRAGEFTLNGQPLPMHSPRQLARLCGYIPQRSGIAIDISALDVVLMGFNPRLSLLEHPSPAMKARAAEALAQAGLAGMEAQNYLTLSEGQKQLCLFARAMVMDCPLLLLDEPESALDLRHRYAMMALLRRRLEREGGCALLALHDPQLALEFCHKLVLLQDGHQEAVLHPREDSREIMEQALGRIYGPVSLAACRDRAGNVRLVMLKEREELQ